MDMNDLAKSLFNSKRAEGSSSVSNTKTVQGTVVEDSEDGKVKVVIDGDCVTEDGTNEVEIGTVASLKEGEGGGVMRPTALGSVGWGDKAAKTATAYITEIDNAGITVHPAGSTDDYAQINANGMDVVKGGTSVAQFGSTARVGTATGQNVKIDADSVDICTGDSVDATFSSSQINLGTWGDSTQVGDEKTISFFESSGGITCGIGETRDYMKIGSGTLYLNSYDGVFVTKAMLGGYTWAEVRVVSDVLYNDSTETGTNGTVSLTASASNYNHLRIYYYGKSSASTAYKRHGSTDVYSPNGKYVCLSAVAPQSPTSSAVDIACKVVLISGSQITTARATAGNLQSSPAAGVYNEIYITRVEAWNE